jgi:hypothetical protein
MCEVAVVLVDLINTIKTEHLFFSAFVLFIFIFKNPISNLINRITSINKNGLIAESKPDSQREKTDPEAVKQLLEMVGTSVLIQERESAIKQDLTQRHLDVESDTCRVLIRYLAGTQLLLTFVDIHNLIFGSQIILLKKLNELVEIGMTEDSIKGYINNVMAIYTTSFDNWTNDQYLAFLYIKKLIVRNGDLIHISHIGKEYLIWIVRNGQSENKPF